MEFYITIIINFLKLLNIMKNFTKQETSSLNAANVDAQMVDASVINHKRASHLLERIARIYKYKSIVGMDYRFDDFNDCYMDDPKISTEGAFRSCLLKLSYKIKIDEVKTYTKCFIFKVYLFDDHTYKLQDLFTDVNYVYNWEDMSKERYQEPMEVINLAIRDGIIDKALEFKWQFQRDGLDL